RRNRRSPRAGVRRQAGARHCGLVLGRVCVDTLRDRERQLWHVEWVAGPGAGGEPRHRRSCEDRRCLRACGPANLRGRVKSLDAFLPSYEFVTRHEVEVDADPVRAERALREVTCGEIPLARGLLFGRCVGARRAGDTVAAAMSPGATGVQDVPGEGLRLT